MEKEKTWLAEEAKKHDKGKHMEREICGPQRKIKTKIDNDEKVDNILRWKNIFLQRRRRTEKETEENLMEMETSGHGHTEL